MAYPNPELELAHRAWENNPALTSYREQPQGMVELFEENGRTIQMPSDWFFGQSAAFIGETGSGKTQTVKRFAYEMHIKTGLNMTFFDPEGDYWVFRDLFPEWQVYGKNHALKPDNAKSICERTIKSHTPSVIVLGETDKNEWIQFVINYLNTEWLISENLRSQGLPIYHMNILEEAQEFLPFKIPEDKDRWKYFEMRNLLNNKFSSRGRKRGATIALVTQRVQKLNPDSVTQMGLRFLHKVNSPLDIKRYGEWLGQSQGAVKPIIDKLDKGMAIVDGQFNNDGYLHVYQVRKLWQLRDVSQTARPDGVYRTEEYFKRGGNLYGENSYIPRPADSSYQTPLEEPEDGASLSKSPARRGN